MSTSELVELEALLERVLRDPKDFAERICQQMVDRLSTEHPGVEQLVVVDSQESTAHEALADRNLLLAAAVGACDCWGREPDCDVCGGEGSAGWAQPDPRLYAEYIEPTAQRMPTRDWPASSTSPVEPPMNGEPE